MLIALVEVWTENFQISDYEGRTHFGMPRGDKMSLAPNEFDIQWSSFKPPHPLQVGTKNTPNMKYNVIRKTTNSRLELQLS